MYQKYLQLNGEWQGVWDDHYNNKDTDVHSCITYTTNTHEWNVMHALQNSLKLIRFRNEATNYHFQQLYDPSELNMLTLDFENCLLST